MPEATEWLNQYYPIDGSCINPNDTENCASGNAKTRGQITSLDISHKNLMGILNFTDFTSLLNINMSFNEITHFNPAGEYDFTNGTYANNGIETIDLSHNNYSFDFGTWEINAMKVLNFSYNSAIGGVFIAPNLAYLDASNNNLTSLGLSQASQSLVELKCSNNPFNPFGGGLDLTNAPLISTFECLDTNLYSLPTSTNLDWSIGTGIALVTYIPLGGVLTLATAGVAVYRNRYLDEVKKVNAKVKEIEILRKQITEPQMIAQQVVPLHTIE